VLREYGYFCRCFCFMTFQLLRCLCDQCDRALPCLTAEKWTERARSG